MGIPNVWRKPQVMTYYNFLYAAPPSNLRGNPLIRRIISAVCPQNQFIEGLVPSFHIIKKKKKKSSVSKIVVNFQIIIYLKTFAN